MAVIKKTILKYSDGTTHPLHTQQDSYFHLSFVQLLYFSSSNQHLRITSNRQVPALPDAQLLQSLL